MSEERKDADESPGLMHDGVERETLSDNAGESVRLYRDVERGIRVEK